MGPLKAVCLLTLTQILGFVGPVLMGMKNHFLLVLKPDFLDSPIQLVNQYPEPSCAIGGSRAKMDTSPMVLFALYSSGYQEQAAVGILEALARSRFTGDVSPSSHWQ